MQCFYAVLVAAVGWTKLWIGVKRERKKRKKRVHHINPVVQCQVKIISHLTEVVESKIIHLSSNRLLQFCHQSAEQMMQSHHLFESASRVTL